MELLHELRHAATFETAVKHILMDAPRNAANKGERKEIIDTGMTKEELKDYKKEVLDAERLKIVLLLQEAQNLEQAIELVKQRVGK